ncbi:MAG TPA: hypothetical protein PLA83_13865, partial [Deltaproteobacteria bacterium]|nr:hypothetical protein [Deltaproteobacteria bacterium]
GARGMNPRAAGKDNANKKEGARTIAKKTTYAPLSGGWRTYLSPVLQPPFFPTKRGKGRKPVRGDARYMICTERMRIRPVL